jgi:hypothetical protein
MITIQLENGKNVSLDTLPNDCPYCHKSITPRYLVNNTSNHGLEIIFKCPNIECGKAIIGYYDEIGGDNFIFNNCNIGEVIETKFKEEIQSLSPIFVKVFNEASFAEQHHLTEICGVGYRKALEFLVKDYLIKNNPTKEERIKKLFLGNCIQEFVTDTKIKIVAERATWLGNDETHYVKVWEDKTLTDLKKLIELTLHWIEMEELSKSFEIKMPNKK